MACLLNKKSSVCRADIGDDGDYIIKSLFEKQKNVLQRAVVWLCDKGCFVRLEVITKADMIRDRNCY